MRSLLAPCTHNYILLYTSAHPAPVSRCRVSLLCHLNEPLRLLLFYLVVCRSCCEVGSRPSPALPLKVSERRMKLCRSDESQRLTANSHQSSCGRWGGGRDAGCLGARRFSEDSPLLTRPIGLLCADMVLRSKLQFTHNTSFTAGERERQCQCNIVI